MKKIGFVLALILTLAMLTAMTVVTLLGSREFSREASA